MIASTHVYPAHLPVLGAGVRLRHGPLIVTIERWSDGSIVARVPALRLYASGDTDALALDALAEEIAEFAIDVHARVKAGAQLGGVLAKQWAGIEAMVEFVAP